MIWLAFLLAVLPEPTVNQDLKPQKAYKLVDRLFESDPKKRAKARDELIKAADLSIAPALVEAIFFNGNGRLETGQVLDALFNRDFGTDYKKWVAFIGSRQDLQPKEGYLAFKARLFARIDPKLAVFFDANRSFLIRPEEIISGGVKKDGIPALDNPLTIPAQRATWLTADDLVFGAVVGGEARAWPHRILDWHEMANDVVGGIPVCLSYCTLCGSGILFETGLSGQTYTFGSSGLLYRSNKLMYDRQTDSLWSNLTGQPVSGPLAGREIQLKILPLEVTTWGDWLLRYPQTRVLSQMTGYNRDYRPGAAYGQYFASPDTMFPVWNAVEQTSSPKLKDWMWVATIKNHRKAWPLDILIKKSWLEDSIAGEPVLLVTNPQNGAVQVFHLQAGLKLSRTPNGEISDNQGRTYRYQDEMLISHDDQVKLPRVAGHRTYWFSWISFFPDQETYREPD